MNTYDEEKEAAKQALLNEYFGLESNSYPQENAKLNKKFQAFIKLHGHDTQVLETMALNTADKNFRMVDKFSTFSPQAAPVLQRLAEAETWDLIDLRLLTRYLVFSTDPVQTVALAERAFQLLDSAYAHEPFYRRAQLVLHTNLTSNFLKLHTLKLNNPEQPVDLIQQFSFHADAVLSAPDLDQFPLFHGIVAIRKGLVANYPRLVDQGFELLKSLKSVNARGFEQRKSMAAQEFIFLMELEREHYESIAYGRVGETSLKITLGGRIRDYRKNKNLTMEQLAEMADLSTASMSEIERGITGVSAIKFYLLSKALDIPMEILLGLPESPELTPKQAQAISWISTLDKRDTDIILNALKIMIKHSNKKN